MNRKYHVVMYHTKCWLWEKWHGDLRRFFDGKERYTPEPPPWYHMCCSGGYPDWRTRLCEWLEGYEGGYRKHERILGWDNWDLDGGDDE